MDTESEPMSELEEIAETCDYCEAELDEDETWVCSECSKSFCSPGCLEYHLDEECE